MPPIRVIVAAATADLQAEGIRAAVEAESGGGIRLLGSGVVAPEAVVPLLRALPAGSPCAVILVRGRTDDESDIAEYKRCLDEVGGLVLLHVAVGDESIDIAARNVSMDALLAAVRSLLVPQDETGLTTIPVGVVINHPFITAKAPDTLTDPGLEAIDDAPPWLLKPAAPLLGAAIDWAHSLLSAAVERLVETLEDGAKSVRMAAVADWLDARPPRTPLLAGNEKLAKAERVLEEAFDTALSGPGADEPLARLIGALELDATEARLMILALVPELDPRYQRWISLLTEDSGRRCGSLGLLAEMIGDSGDVLTSIATSGALARWRLLEPRGVLPAADEPLRVDPALRDWLFGGTDALAGDEGLRGVLRAAPWAGTSLIADGAERVEARALIARIAAGTAWLLLDGGALPGWRALIEAGAAQTAILPLRVELAQLAGLDEPRIEEIAIRLARLARLTGRPLVLDASGIGAAGASENGAEPTPGRGLAVFLGVLEAAECRGAVLAPDPARLAPPLGTAPYRIEHRAHGGALRAAAFELAASAAGAAFTTEAAESLINLFPLEIDGFEQAMRVALATPLSFGEAAQASRERFIAACKGVAAESASGLAQRIEPTFTLDDLVLPQDRKDQLREIVSNIRFAPKVLDGWKFRDQLPYGLGVTALFYGPSGTGKTMGAFAVAKELGVQVLRIDLSRLVSKYIGETEKNIDRIFLEAQRSGAALLIDEADGLLSRRGEVKDANDRYANLEVAYLLQRMEAYEGLAIMTTNLRQNLDSAFMRRLRFVIDFPRPDAAAREAIWRYCLPTDAHELEDVDFKLLARRVELTGGSIRQITLRAAFVAAAASPPGRIGMAEIAQATRAEYVKLGVPPVDVGPAQERKAA